MDKRRRGWLVKGGQVGEAGREEVVDCNMENRALHLLLQPRPGSEGLRCWVDGHFFLPSGRAGKEMEGFLRGGLGKMEHVLLALLRALLLTEASPATLPPTHQLLMPPVLLFT